MVKKRISFDINIPDNNGFGGFGKKKSKIKKSLKKAYKKKGVKIRAAIPRIYGDAYGQYKKKLLLLVSNFLEQELGVLAAWIRDAINIKKKIRAFTFYFAFILAGVVIVLHGIADYVVFLCPWLPAGTGYMLVGLVVILVALLFRRSI